MKKLKGIWIALLTVVLTVAMLMGTTTISAFASFTSSNITADGSNTATFITKMVYGEPTDAFKGAKLIVSPSGEKTETITGSFTPLEIGAYTVYYADYSYVVSCYLDNDYELRVDNNGAEIATYVQAGGTLKVPAAHMWYPSERNGVDYEIDENQQVYVTIDGIDSSKYKAEANELQEVELPDNPYTYTVHYFCKLAGNTGEGSKYISKDFTVIAQKTFKDDTKPVLSVVSIPRSISLNTKVTLPKATATDNLDTNVLVTVTVEQYVDELKEYKPVKVVNVDDNGYAEVPTKEGKYFYDETAENVRFENDYNMSFYPVSATSYRITYTAEDDNGNVAASSHVYPTTASDKTSPLLVDIDDSIIASSWGLNKVENDKDGELSDKAGILRFPRPNYVDNSGMTPVVIFELRDSVNNNVVIRFDDINDIDGGKNTYTYDPTKASYGLYQPLDDSDKAATVTWAKDGDLVINLKWYTDNLDENKTATGTYTVRYEARDSVPNTTSKTYEISIEDEFADIYAPDIKDVNFADSFIVYTDGMDEEFTVPEVEISDDIDTRPTVTYYLYAGQDENGAHLEVEGGEVLTLKYIEDKPAIENEDGEYITFDTDKTLVYEVTATDDAGNVSVVTNRRKDPAKKSDNEITIVDGNDIAAVSAINYNKATVANTGTDGVDYDVKGAIVADAEGSGKLVVGKRVNIGSFYFEISNADYRDYYGFELSLYTTTKDEDGKSVTEQWTTGRVTVQMYVDVKNTKVHMDNVTFSVPNAEKVTAYVRAFDITGKSYTVSCDFDIDKASTDEDNKFSAVEMGSSGSVYTEYLIKNRSMDRPADLDTTKDYIVREITGNGKFSLMGFRFAAYNAGSFYFSEYYNSNKTNKLELLDKGNEKEFVVTQTATPAWQMLGRMPSHVEVSSIVNLPKVTATTEYANAKVTLNVSFRAAGSNNSTNLSVAQEESEIGNKGKAVTLKDGIYSFKATADGEYTITYSASLGDGSSIEQSYTIKSGDIVPPDFEIVGEHARTAVENGEFTFKEVKLLSDESNTDKIAYRKILRNDDGAEVYVVNGTGESFRTATKPSNGDAYKFTQAGVYTVEYQVTDAAGNTTRETYSITVTAAKVNNPVSTKIISTILIIVGVLLIAGVILYFVRFRKVKSK